MKTSNRPPEGGERERVALVTGANSGLGEAAARRLAAAGWRVALLGRTVEELEEVRADLESERRQAVVVVADLRDVDEMRRAVEKAANTWGRLDTVFANAGINGVWDTLDALPVEEWDKTLNINLRGTFLTVKFALPHPKIRGGSVIVTSSVNGTRMFSNQGATAYAVSKAGQVALVKMLAIELARDKIRINAICPGWIDTEIPDNTDERIDESEKVRVKFPDGIVPLSGGKPGRPEQVADLVHFLAGDASSHITGSVIHIDGGESLLQG